VKKREKAATFFWDGHSLGRGEKKILNWRGRRGGSLLHMGRAIINSSKGKNILNLTVENTSHAEKSPTFPRGCEKKSRAVSALKAVPVKRKKGGGKG